MRKFQSQKLQPFLIWLVPTWDEAPQGSLFNIIDGIPDKATVGKSNLPGILNGMMQGPQESQQCTLKPIMMAELVSRQHQRFC